MAFTVSDFQDLLRLLKEHPEWRDELRILLLTEEILTLPQVVRELAEEVRALAEAQRRTEQRVEELAEEVRAIAEAQRRTEQRVEELAEEVRAIAEAQRKTEQRVEELAEEVRAIAEAQRKTEQRVEELAEEVRAIAEAQRKTEQRVEELAEAQRKTEQELKELAKEVRSLAHQVWLLTEASGKLEGTVGKLEDTVGKLRGMVLELLCSKRAPSYFGRFLKRTKVVEVISLEDSLLKVLSQEEFGDLLALDMLVSGRLRQLPEEPEVWLAVEVSSVIDPSDVERATRRAHALKKAGFPALPVVMGEKGTLEAEDMARSEKVVVIYDGKVFLWEEALGKWIE